MVGKPEVIAQMVPSSPYHRQIPARWESHRSSRADPFSGSNLPVMGG